MDRSEQLEHKLTHIPRPERRQSWTLQTMLDAQVTDFRGRSISGLHYYLHRSLKFSRQRHRHYVHSPDVDYDAKLKLILELIGHIAPAEGAEVYFGDEWTLYNHSVVGYDYRRRGLGYQPLAPLSQGGDRIRRISGLLNVASGAMCYIHRKRISVPALRQLFQGTENAARQRGASGIFVILDNWPVHFHPELLAYLQPQRFAEFGYRLPSSWKEIQASKKAQAYEPKLAVQLIALPTYAPWLNPIERLWKLLTDRYVRGHQMAADFNALQQHMLEQLELLTQPNEQILRYCGLMAENGLYTKCRKRLVNATVN